MAPIERLPSRTKGCCVTVARPLRTPAVDKLAAIYKALADPTRIQMVHMLKHAKQPICVCDFVAAFDLGQPTVSHHITKLRDAGIVRSEKRGLWSFYELDPRMHSDVQSVIAIIE